MNAAPRESDLPRWLWLWFPPLIVVALVVSKAMGEDAYVALMRTENSLVELGTVVLLLVAVVTGLRLFLRRGSLPETWLGAWVGLLTLGCIYFAGEEASWGQHYFGWGTPEALASVNAQGETNIHNISGLFDQLPRNLLTLGALVGGIFAPLWLRRRHGDWRGARGKWGWLVPTVVCLPTAVLSVVIGLPKKLTDNTDVELPSVLVYQGGEFKEYFFGLLLMLYLLSLSRRTSSSVTGS
jgi:hypothetical protein